MSGRGGWLAAPVVVATLLLVMLPLLGTAALAFFHYDALSAPRAAGFENFLRLARDPMFAITLKNSLWIAAVAVPLRVGLALGLALLLHGPGRANAAGRAASFAPMVVPDIAWALAWLWMVNPFFGPAAWLLNAWQPEGAQALLSATGARLSLVAVMALLVGEMMLVLVAVRREIPPELYEVGALEGASRLTLFRRVTLPLLLPAVLLLTCRDVALSLQASFVPALIVTDGGPQFATTLLPLYVFQNAFEYLRFGYASALSLAMLAIVLAAVALQLVLLRRALRY